MPTVASETTSCAHCGAVPGPGEARVRDGRVYCCAGCETVATLIASNGWNEFYDRRVGYSPRPSESQAYAAFDAGPFQKRHVRTLADGDREAVLRIGGLRCAACVWLNEKALLASPGVRSAHVSYGTGRLTVRWDPRAARLSDIAAIVDALGYRVLPVDARDDGDRDLLVRLAVAAFCGGNVMLLYIGMYAAGFSGGMAARYEHLFAWASLILATPAAIYSGSPFFERAVAGLRHGILSMDVPIALAIAIMYGHGIVAVRMGQEAYLDTLTMLVGLLLAGRYVEARGRARAGDAAEAVLAQLPTTAQRREDGGVVREVAAEELRVDDVIVAGLGSVVAADGEVVDGVAELDVSHVTGESVPVAVRVGDRVSSGSVVLSGRVDLRVTGVGDGSTVGRIGELVRTALTRRSPAMLLADRIAPWFTLATIVVSAAVYTYWHVVAGFETAFPIVIAVLVVACPCALSLAVPAAVASGIGAAAARGAFVRDGEALERLGRMTRAAVDKTGTLTDREPRVTEGPDWAVRVAAALEAGSRHPIARAIVSESRRRGLDVPRATGVSEEAGRGVSGEVDGVRYTVGSAGAGAVRLTGDDGTSAVLVLSESVRSDARQLVRALGVPVSLLSGDHPDAVSRVAEVTGVEVARGALSPADKAEWIAERRAAGDRVLFVGDGMNDAPALATADAGVAMGHGAEASRATADVVILDDSLRPVAAALAAGRVTRATLRRNATLAISYNIIAVALASFGLIGPLFSAVAMPISSLIVIGNAMRIPRRVDREMEKRWTS